jgi:uncharacterized membrane protein YeiH
VLASLTTQSGVFLVIAVIGTIGFATSGVMAAAESDMDWLGALVLAVVVSIGGGTLRDVLIGNLPVTWVRDEWPVWVGLATGIVGITLLRVRPSTRLTHGVPYLAADAVGLGAFVVLGTSISLEAGTSAFIAVLMGVITGVGGGVVRDVLTSRRPMVLVGQVYAVAGLCGAVAHVALDAADSREEVKVWVPIALIVVLRYFAVRYDWHLPRTLGTRRPDADGN